MKKHKSLKSWVKSDPDGFKKVLKDYLLIDLILESNLDIEKNLNFFYNIHFSSYARKLIIEQTTNYLVRNNLKSWEYLLKLNIKLFNYLNNNFFYEISDKLKWLNYFRNYDRMSDNEFKNQIIGFGNYHELNSFKDFESLIPIHVVDKIKERLLVKSVCITMCWFKDNEFWSSLEDDILIRLAKSFVRKYDIHSVNEFVNNSDFKLAYYKTCNLYLKLDGELIYKELIRRDMFKTHDNNGVHSTSIYHYILAYVNDKYFSLLSGRYTLSDVFTKRFKSLEELDKNLLKLREEHQIYTDSLLEKVIDDI